MNQTPSPFFAAREASNNFGNSFKRVREENALDSILSEAMKSGDPEVLKDSIGKILSQVSPERQGAAVQLLQNSMQNIQKRQQDFAQKNALIKEGINPNLPTNLQKSQYDYNLNNQRANNIISGNNPNPMESTGEQNLNDLSDEQLAALSGVKGFSEQAKQILENRRAAAKKIKPGDEFSKIREKTVAEYVNNALAARDDAEEMKYTIETAKKAIQGEIAGPGIEAYAKNNPYMQIMIGLTPDEASLQAANKKLLEGTKGIFGSKPTEREIFLLLNSMLPSIGKTKEANLAGVDFIERVNDLKLKFSDTVSDLTDGGTKYVPDLEKKVNETMKPYIQDLRKDLNVANEVFNTQIKNDKNSNAEKILVISPDGQKGYMTQTQIDEAKKKNVIFKPVK